MEKISIVSTIYNKGPWLERFFETILSQTYQNIEVVAVDNAATDNSLEIIERYASKDLRVRIVRIEKNNGPSNGFRAGLDAITGDYFTIIDADDYIDPDYIEKLYNAIKSENADVSMCVNDLVWDSGKRWHKQWPDKEKIVIDGDLVKRLPMQLLDELSDKYFGFYMPEIGAVWCKMYRTSFIRENNLNFEKDYWIWCDFVFNFDVMKKVQKLVYINTACYHFYQSEDSITRPKNMQRELKNRFLMAMNKIYDMSIEIMNPNLERASNRFYLNQIIGITNYYYGYYPKEVSIDDINSIIYDTINSNCAKQLFSSNFLPKLTLYESFFVFLSRRSKTIIALRLNKILVMPRRIASKVYRWLKNNK